MVARTTVSMHRARRAGNLLAREGGNVIELLALAGAIAMIVGVLMLRAVAALPFPRLRSRWVPAQAPTGTEELFAEAAAELAALGFAAPRWLLAERCDGEPAPIPLRAVFHHPESGALACLAPPPAPKHPHQLLTWFAHRLADGRWVVSQAFDAYHAMIQGEGVVAQTLGVPGLAAQWQAHCDWVATLGETLPVAADEDVLASLDALYEQRRQSLMAARALQPVSPDLALPTLGFALRLLRAYLATPVPPPDARPVPPARLALLARAAEEVRHRSPLRRVQWTLFGASVALFMALGAVLWDVQMAGIILAVVLFHELGHFLAMRAFGYRNTHILALPLVGGVAMGFDANPGATRSAWMSLMGPLPGIVLGWILLVLALFGQAPDWAQGWLMPLALVMLVINYLNVLPIPPLDGAHVVQALLPRSLARLRTIFVGVACVLGAILALALGFWILVALPLLQLLALPAQWRLNAVEEALVRQSSLAGLPPALRLSRVFQAMEQLLGPTPQAALRVEQGLQLANALRAQPMGGAARLLTGSVYLGLLVVPVAGLLAWAIGMGSLLGGASPAYLERWQAQQEEAAAEARALSFGELVAALQGPDARPARTSAESIEEAESRLGRRLPMELRELYAGSDGIPALDLLPLARLQPAARLVDELAGQGVDTVWLYHQDEQRELALASLRDWWLLRDAEDDWLLIDPAQSPRLEGLRVLWMGYGGEGHSGHASLRDWLETAYVQQRMAERSSEDLDRASERARRELAQAPLPELLQGPEPQGLLIRLLARPPALPGPVDGADLDALQSRAGFALPADYRELLALHDGFPPLQLFPADQVQPWRQARGAIVPELLPILLGQFEGEESMQLASGAKVMVLDEAELGDCLVLAGYRYRGDGVGDDLHPTLLLCPPHSHPEPLIQLAERRRYAGLRPWLVEQAARRRAAGSLLEGG
jgi:Zn-dependent protease